MPGLLTHPHMIHVFGIGFTTSIVYQKQHCYYGMGTGQYIYRYMCVYIHVCVHVQEKIYLHLIVDIHENLLFNTIVRAKKSERNAIAFTRVLATYSHHYDCCHSNCGNYIHSYSL